jgi:hypothetical protein
MSMTRPTLNGTVSASAACDLLAEATELIREDPNRSGSTLTFGAAGQLVMTGDMHGARRNLDKLKRFCQLDRNPARSVILHELIHEEPQEHGGADLSIDLLLEALQWKVDHPDNVFFLQSNHEMAQLRRHEITKGGRSVLYDFERGLEQRFGADGAQVLAGVEAYIAALPLAAKTAKGVFMAHSLPDALAMQRFDLDVLGRELTGADMDPGGAAYDLVWGRFQKPADLDQFAERLGVKMFVVGHTPQDDGFGVTGRMIVLASDHSHGVFLPIDLSRDYSDADALAAQARKFVSVE